MKLGTRDEQKLLHKCGFPIAVDGQFGPRSRQARRDFRRACPRNVKRSWTAYKKRLQWSAANNGKCSPHFYFRDFASNGNGWIKVDYTLLVALEELRPHVGPINVLSGYRDPVYNVRIGGSKFSIHMFGGAVDPVKKWALSAVLKIKRFSGVGTDGSSSGPCRHGDTRGQGSVPNFTPGATRFSPVRWIY